MPTDVLNPERKEVKKVEAKERRPLTIEGCRILWELHEFVHRGVDAAEQNSVRMSTAAANDAADARSSLAAQSAKAALHEAKTDGERLLELIYEFVDTTYGHAGRQLLLSQQPLSLEQERLNEQNMPLEDPMTVKGGKGEKGDVAEPGLGGVAMSLDTPPGTMLHNLLDAKFIDADHARTLGAMLNSGKPATCDAAVRQIHTLVNAHNVKAQRMSLDVAKRQEADVDSTLDKAFGKQPPEYFKKHGIGV